MATADNVGEASYEETRQHVIPEPRGGHTAISMALHSTLVSGPLGVNLHPLAAMAGHSMQTLEDYYRHVIVRYLGKPAIDLVEECARARRQVEEAPFRG